MSTPPKKLLKLETNTLCRRSIRMISGGASGADYALSLMAIRSDLRVDIMSFPGHDASVPLGCKVRILTEAELLSVDDELDAVAKSLGRRASRVGYVRNLLRRNIHIVKDVEAVFAITTIVDGGITGGTAWGCRYHSMFAKSPKLFVFDMTTDKWKTYREDAWVDELPPNPDQFARCALIGSRAVTPAGQDAINTLFKT